MTKTPAPKTEKESLDLAWQMIDQLIEGALKTLKHLIDAQAAIIELDARISAIESETSKKRLQ